jgi:hypothetical protein
VPNVLKTKDSYEITDLFFNKTILDMEGYSNGEEIQPSEYIFFVKDTYYDGDLNNKLSLIIIDKDTGYVVNNNFKFNSLEVLDRKITIYRIEDNKRKESYYWFK